MSEAEGTIKLVSSDSTEVSACVTLFKHTRIDLFKQSIFFIKKGVVIYAQEHSHLLGACIVLYAILVHFDRRVSMDTLVQSGLPGSSWSVSLSALYYTFLSFSFSHQNINHHHLTCCVSNVHTTAIAQQFPVAMSVAKMSVTIKNMLDDLGEDDDQPIPLPNVSNNSIFQLAYICNIYQL